MSWAVLLLFFRVLLHTQYALSRGCSKWQTKEDQPVAVEEALAVDEDAVGVVPDVAVGEESRRTKTCVHRL